MQNVEDSFNNALKQLAAAVEKSDFGLAPKNDDAKTIDQAQKTCSAILRITSTGEREEDLDELDNHLMSISNYKPPTCD